MEELRKKYKEVKTTIKTIIKRGYTMPLKNPLNKEGYTLKGGCKIGVLKEDFDFFQDYSDIYNQFEMVAVQENQDIESKRIKEVLHNATFLFQNKQYSFDKLNDYVKDPSTLKDASAKIFRIKNSL